LEEKVTADQLVGEYRPDQTSYEDFTFRFKRRPGYFALIEVEAASKPTKYEREPGSIREYRWDFVCDQLTKTSRKPSRKQQEKQKGV
jgi:hypothetical protein